MPATEVDLDIVVDAMTASVKEAGDLALSLFQKPLRNWTKGPSASPVSEADIAVNDLLREQLSAIDKSFAWLSEESVDDTARLDARYVWIVDPIDGTRAYIEGLADWAVSVALIERDRPVVACLYAPAIGEFFAARRGGGATRNGAAIAVNPGAELKDARIAGPRKLMDRLAAIAPPFVAMPRVPSLALRLARVADGTVDAAIAGGNSHDWDLAAADLLVHEAGGMLTPVAGGTVTYNRPVPRHGTLVATGRDRYAALIAILGDGRLAYS
ncbi:MAG TPA: 3'(2'),5'-bisphosphate nucleotidase CysQ [Xanthobacteraceae bacterium]|nr:3'(2'),5'-bisphosphate nucleotidase CysQ [Xanthobacteraceae bacterium]